MTFVFVVGRDNDSYISLFTIFFIGSGHSMITFSSYASQKGSPMSYSLVEFCSQILGRLKTISYNMGIVLDSDGLLR